MQEINLVNMDFGNCMFFAQNKQKTHISSGSSNDLKSCRIFNNVFETFNKCNNLYYNSNITIKHIGSSPTQPSFKCT